MLFHQSDDRKGGPGWNQCLVPAEGVLGGLDAVDDGSVGTGSTDAPLFHLLDQARLGVTTDGLSAMLLGIEFCESNSISDFDRREQGLLGSSRVCQHETLVIDHGSARLVAGGFFMLLFHFDDDGSACSRLHLAGDGALPDQVVETGFVVAHLGGDFCGIVKIGGADRFMFTTRVLGEVLEIFRGVFVCSVLFGDQGSDRLHRFRSENVVVGTDVGDETFLEECIGGTHRSRGGESEAVGGFLLHATGDEGHGRFA